MEVPEILNRVKSFMKSGKYDMVPTIKNRNSKRKYGLTQYDIENYIASLEAEDLYKGPEPDRDCPGEELFIFKKEIIPNVVFYLIGKFINNIWNKLPIEKSAKVFTNICSYYIIVSSLGGALWKI